MPKTNRELPEDVITLARLALSGRPQDIHLMIHKLSKQYREQYPEMTQNLISLLQENPTRSSPLRKEADVPLPVDLDSRLQLLRIERTDLDHGLMLSPSISNDLSQIIAERKQTASLMKAGLNPTKSVLFTGPPGVGKTMAARWLAAELNQPLLVLDLTAVMSSFLGKTGNNVRYVLDYAKNRDCILLLDELDAIAKRRDDTSEVGELKRLVTVLLQEIDDWPSTRLLLAATNHPDLLDPAVWRRFEMVLSFPLPSAKQINDFVHDMLRGYSKRPDVWSTILSILYRGRSFSEIEREILLAKRNSIVHHVEMDEQLKRHLSKVEMLSKADRIGLANGLIENKITSQREANEITGLSRTTIRKYAPSDEKKGLQKPVKKRK